MKKYLLDTHILIWHLEGSKKESRFIYDEIESYSGNLFVSVESLREIVILQKLNKITLSWSIDKVIERLNHYNIFILTIDPKHVLALEKLSHPIINGKTHDDPFDRMLIAQSIAEKLTIISADTKFPFYRDKGFHLLQNE